MVSTKLPSATRLDNINLINKERDSEPETSVLLSLPSKKVFEPAENFSKFQKDKSNHHKMTHLEPHAVRRAQILQKYPQITKLFKKDPYTILWVFFIHFIQLYFCLLIKHYNFSLWKTLILALTIGAIFNHSLFVLIHDITHFNCFKTQTQNKIWAIFANLPQIIPSAIGFGRYHKDHHSFLGDAKYDPDIPTIFEINFFNTWYKKLFYVVFMPAFYGLRPYFKTPKKPSGFELINTLCCVIYGFLIFYFFGMQSFTYLFSSTWFGLSIHPVGAHVMAEHYEFCKGQDTYSYYGILNYLNFNMGYHIEHHDFPNIPWSKLPLVRKIAPEFYDNLPSINSYSKVVLKYIFDSSIGPWSRISIDSYSKIMDDDYDNKNI